MDWTFFNKRQICITLPYHEFTVGIVASEPIKASQLCMANCTAPLSGNKMKKIFMHISYSLTTLLHIHTQVVAFTVKTMVKALNISHSYYNSVVTQNF